MGSRRAAEAGRLSHVSTSTALLPFPVPPRGKRRELVAGSSFSQRKEAQKLLRNEVTHASDVELLAAVIGNRRTAEKLLKQADVIHRRGPWRHLEAVEHATLEWVDWFNHRGLLKPIGNVPPAELEASYYHSTSQLPVAA